MSDGAKTTGAVLAVTAAIGGGLVHEIGGTASMIGKAVTTSASKTAAVEGAVIFDFAGAQSSRFGHNALDLAPSIDGTGSASAGSFAGIKSPGSFASTEGIVLQPPRIIHQAILPFPRLEVGSHVEVQHLFDTVAANSSRDIALKLEQSGQSLSADEIAALIQSQVAKSVQALATNQKDKLTKITLLQGKIEFSQNFKIGGMEIAVGEVNLVKIGAAGAAGVIACKGLHAIPLRTCITAALEKVGTSVIDYPEDKDASAKSQAPENLPALK